MIVHGVFHIIQRDLNIFTLGQYIFGNICISFFRLKKKNVMKVKP